MDTYFDPTCTKDPWEELENLEKQKIAEEENAAKVSRESSEDSSSENETESVSEDKSSSSSAEEETS